MSTLDELTALEARATKAPWTVGEGRQSNDGPGLIVDISGPGYAANIVQNMSEADAALISAARNALPDLIKIAKGVAKLPAWDGEGYCATGCGAVKGEGEVHADDCAWLIASRLGGQ